MAFVKRDVWTPSLRTLWLLCAVAAGDILETWIQPLAREAFFNEVFEKTWAHFPHSEALVEITLDHVAGWIREQGNSEEVLEILPHPVTQKSFKASKTSKDSLQQVSEAFLQGFSMVFNSLHKWSEPGARLAKHLYASAHLPVDVYMYLTPPHSHSYGMHSDASRLNDLQVMDAFMVQLAGHKVWTVCDVPSWMAPNQRPEVIMKNFNVSCSNVTLQGGDILYLPFGTLHQARTDTDFSMHLTVNLERQYYVWQSLFLAMIHKATNPGLRIKKFVSSGEFQPDDHDLPLVSFLAKLAAMVPELNRMPGFSFAEASTSILLTSLSNQDLPKQYLDRVTSEFQDLATRLEAAASSLGASRTVRLPNGRSVSLSEALGKIKTTETLLPWALQLARFHAMVHFSPVAKPHQLLSLSAIRSRNPTSFTDLPLLELPETLPDTTQLMRAPNLRAVLLAEGSIDVPPQHKLIINQETFPIHATEAPAAEFCLSLFAAKTAKGRPFTLSQVPKGSARLLPKLISFGALQIVAEQP